MFEATQITYGDGRNIDLTQYFVKGIEVMEANDDFIYLIQNSINGGRVEAMSDGRTVSLFGKVKKELTLDTNNPAVGASGRKFQKPASIRELTKIGEFKPTTESETLVIDSVDFEAVGFSSVIAKEVMEYEQARLVMHQELIIQLMVDKADQYQRYSGATFQVRSAQPNQTNLTTKAGAISDIKKGIRLISKITQNNLYAVDGIYDITRAITNYAKKIGVVNEKAHPFIRKGSAIRDLVIMCSPDAYMKIQASGTTQILNLPSGLTREVKAIEGIPVIEASLVDTVNMGANVKPQIIIFDKRAFFLDKDPMSSRTSYGKLEVGGVAVLDKGNNATETVELAPHQSKLKITTNEIYGEQIPGLVWAIGTTN